MSICSTQNLHFQRRRDSKQWCWIFLPAWLDSGTQCFRTMEIPDIEEWFPTQDRWGAHKTLKNLSHEISIFLQDRIWKTLKTSDKFKIYLIYTNLWTVKIHRLITRISKTCNQILAVFLCFCILLDITTIILGDFFFIIKHFSRHFNTKPTCDLCSPTVILTAITLNFIIKWHLFLVPLLYFKDLA